MNQEELEILVSHCHKVTNHPGIFTKAEVARADALEQLLQERKSYKETLDELLDMLEHDEVDDAIKLIKETREYIK
ncbi:hypothetical protein ACFL67_00960 [candidate division KSB1 bacterium]